MIHIFTRRDPPKGPMYCLECEPVGDLTALVPVVNDILGWTGSMICPVCHHEYMTTAMGELPWRRTASDIMESLRADGLTWDDVRRISDNLSRMITREMIAETAQEADEALRAKTVARLQEMHRATVEVRP